MSFEDTTCTISPENMELLCSKIEKVLSTKLEPKFNRVFEEVAQLKIENSDLKRQNSELVLQINSLNTSIQGFCQQAVSELKELREGQENLQKLVNQEVHSQSQPEVNNKQTQEPAPLNIIRVPTKGSKVDSTNSRLSQTDMDNPDRVLTPPDSNQSDLISREQTI